MAVVCKMLCNEVPTGEQQSDESVQPVGFGAVWEPDDDKRSQPENAVFGRYTPWGSIRMGIGNPAAKMFFQRGKSYYVTFTEVPEPEEQNDAVIQGSQQVTKWSLPDDPAMTKE